MLSFLMAVTSAGHRMLRNLFGRDDVVVPQTETANDRDEEEDEMTSSGTVTGHGILRSVSGGDDKPIAVVAPQTETANSQDKEEDEKTSSGIFTGEVCEEDAEPRKKNEDDAMESKEETLDEGEQKSEIPEDNLSISDNGEFAKPDSGISSSSSTKDENEEIANTNDKVTEENGAGSLTDDNIEFYTLPECTPKTGSTDTSGNGKATEENHAKSTEENGAQSSAGDKTEFYTLPECTPNVGSTDMTGNCTGLEMGSELPRKNTDSQVEVAGEGIPTRPNEVDRYAGSSQESVAEGSTIEVCRVGAICHQLNCSEKVPPDNTGGEIARDISSAASVGTDVITSLQQFSGIMDKTLPGDGKKILIIHSRQDDNLAEAISRGLKRQFRAVALSEIQSELRFISQDFASPLEWADIIVPVVTNTWLKEICSVGPLEKLSTDVIDSRNVHTIALTHFVASASVNTKCVSVVKEGTRSDYREIPLYFKAIPVSEDPSETEIRKLIENISKMLNIIGILES